MEKNRKRVKTHKESKNLKEKVLRYYIEFSLPPPPIPLPPVPLWTKNIDGGQISNYKIDRLHDKIVSLHGLEDKRGFIPWAQKTKINKELEHATFLSHERKPKVNISHTKGPFLESPETFRAYFG